MVQFLVDFCLSSDSYRDSFFVKTTQAPLLACVLFLDKILTVQKKLVIKKASNE